MSSSIYGIRILGKQKSTITYRVYLIYSDWISLPRTHGFGYLMLKSNWSKTNKSLDQSNSAEDFALDTYLKGKTTIKHLQVSDFQNYPIHPEFTNDTWHYLDTSSNTFHAEKILPNALYQMEVTDEKFIEHLEVGDVWETASCDLWGASWYLEHKSDATHKFYHLYLDDAGKWIVHYGKVGNPGKKDFPFILSEETALKKIKSKQAKGYVLQYQNYDTDFGYEKKHAKQITKPTFDHEALLTAVQNNDITFIQSLLGQGVNLNDYRDPYDHFLAYKCAKRRRRSNSQIALSTIRFLLENGLNPNQASNDMSVAHMLIQSENEALLKLFLEYGLDITLEDPGVLACTAAQQGYIWLLEMAIEQEIDVVNATTNHSFFANGLSALHYATECKDDAFAVIDFLIEKGADLNYNAPSGWGTPLFHAATRGTKAMIDYLIEKGAQIQVKNDKGRNVLHEAAGFGEVEIFSSLLAHGVDGLEPTNSGLFASQILLTRIIGINQAVSEHSLAKLKLLLEKGESFERLNDLKLKPLTYLGENITKKKRLESYEENIILELMDLGLDPAMKDKQNRNLLHLAAKLNLVEVAKKCLALKVPTQEKDKKKMTPKDYAKKFKSTGCLELL